MTNLLGEIVTITDTDHPMYGFIGEVTMHDYDTGEIIIEIDEDCIVSNLSASQVNIYVRDDQ